MDVDADRAHEVAAMFGGVRALARAEDLLDDPDVRAVYIATPPCVHAEQCIAALEAGKHVLVEKPVAMSAGEAAKVKRLARQKGLKLGTGFMMRHHGAHRKIAEMIRSGVLGTPVLGRAQLSCWYPPMAGAWRQDPKLGGGGSFIDMGNHCVDLLEMFLGRATEVCAFTGNLVHPYKAEDSAAVLLRFASGAMGFVDAFFNIPDAASANVLEVYGSRGSVRCEGTIGQGPGGRCLATIEGDAAGYDARQARPQQGSRELQYEQVNTYEAEIRDFSDAIENDREPTVTYDDGIWSMRVCEAVYRSARTGRAVKLGAQP
jgi:predicted dehydrogenase